jgi:hypothetical protein
MSDSSTSMAVNSTVQRSSPAPAVMWLPGAALVGVGLWMVSSGVLGLGYAFFAIGSGCLLVGSVAQGVAWGMDIYKERHPEKPVGQADA